MSSQFQEFITRRVSNSKENEVKEIVNIFSRVEFNKGDLFKQQDTVIDRLGFIESGSARSYFINQKGSEITDEILLEENFLSDIISIRTGESSPIMIELLEKSRLLVAPMDKVWDLLSRNVTFNILIREYIGDRAMNLVKRHLMFLNGTAKERYAYLVSTNPTLLQKYPLRFIATMIGVTQTQLSRIRNEKT